MKSTLVFTRIEKCPFQNTLSRHPDIKLSPRMNVEDFDCNTGNYQILHCQHCNMGITTPQPAKDSLPALYASRESNDFDGENASFIHKTKKLLLRNEIRKLTKKEGTAPKTILDFGTGNGAVALAALEEYPDAKATCADFHSEPPPLLRDKPGIRYLSHDELAKDDQQYEFIILRSVLEHTHDPIQLLVYLKGKLTKNGIIWIEVPNYNSGMLRIFKKYSGCLVYVPFHLFHMSEKTMMLILEEADLHGSVRINAAQTPMMSNVVASLFRVKLNNFLRIIGAFLYPFQVLTELIFRSTTILTIIAKHKV